MTDQQEQVFTGSDDLPSDARAAFQMIEQAFAEIGWDNTELDENSFEFSLAEAMRLLPHRYIKDVQPEAFRGETIILTLNNLYEQLAKGKVGTAIADLVYFIPANLVYDAAFSDKEEVVLPLPTVVRAVGLDALKNHMPQTVRQYDIAGLEDPFKEELAARRGESEATVMFEEEVEEESALAEAVAEQPVAAAAPVPEEPPLPEPDTAPPEAAPEPPAAEAPPPEPEVVSEAEPEAPSEEAPVAAAERPDAVLEPVSVVPVIAEVTAHEPAVAEPAAPSSPEEVAAEAEPQPEPAPKEEPVAGETADAGLGYLLIDLLPLLPEGHVVGSASDADAVVSLDVPDLYKQLAAGIVEVPVSRLVQVIPHGLLSDSARADTESVVRLALPKVVEAVGLELLAAHMPVGTRQYDIARMADPFEKPKDPPRKIERKVRRRRHAGPEDGEGPEPRRAAAGETVVETATPVGPQLWKPIEDTEAEMSYHELPGNININAATVDELMMLNGVTRPIADAILAYRDKKVRFDSIFELQQIPGVDETVFRKMTGMFPSKKRYHRRKRLAGLLRMPPEKVADMAAVAERLAEKPGFAGCIISDRDGFVLAQRGVDALGEGLSAVVPRMVRRIREDMDLIGAGHVSTVSIAIDGVLYTIVASENMTLTAAHEENHVSETDLVFIRKAGKELAWILSLRAYVGPAL